MSEVRAPAHALLERQLLLQLGDRLRRLRKAQGWGTVAMAQRVGISRTTLAAVEAGDATPAIGTYLRVMSSLGVAGDLALLATDVLQAPPADSAAARSRRPRPVVQVRVEADATRHQIQDLQSLALHEEAVRRVRAEPHRLALAQATLSRWRQGEPSRSAELWAAWDDILRQQQWRKALGRTRRAQALRQASPLVTLLTEDERRQVLAQVASLKHGVVLGDAVDDSAP